MNQTYLTTNEQILKTQVWEKLLDKKRETATELMTNYIEENNYIYTIRDDEKSEVWIYEKGIYIPQGKTYIKEFSRKILTTAYTTHIINQIIQKIEADTYINQEDFFGNIIENKICVENGILNLTKRELEEFDPDTFFFTKIPITYEPNAVCPNIETHFKTILKKEEDSEVMFELFGFLLWKNYFIEKGIMFIGNGRNGKGKTIELMKRFIGIENSSSIPLQQFETDMYSSGELFNKLANLSGDLDSKALNHTGMFKTLTGRDLISASRKFLTRVKFTNFAKMVFACNQLPKTHDISTAFWNRWVLFEFPYSFLSEEEINSLNEDEKKNVKLRDTNIIDKLSNPEELSGLLNRSLDGLQRLLTQKDFSHSQGVKEIKDMWIRKSDSFFAFCLDFIEDAEEVKIEKKVLRKAYVRFCKNHKIKPLSDKAIRETLFENFAVSEERNSSTGERYWDGIRFCEGFLVENLVDSFSVIK